MDSERAVATPRRGGKGERGRGRAGRRRGPGLAIFGGLAIALIGPSFPGLPRRASSAQAATQRSKQDEPPPPVLSLLREVKVGRTPSVLALAPKGAVYVSCAFDTAVEVYDTKTFAQEARFRFSPLVPQGLVPLRNGKELMFANYAANTLHWWDLRKGELCAEVQVSFKPVTLAVSADGRVAAAACDQEQEVWFVDVPRHTLRGEPVITSGKPHGMAFDARGKTLYVACGDPTPSLFKVSVGGGQIGFWDTPILDGSDLLVLPSGKELLVAGRAGGLLVLKAEGGAQDPAEGGAVAREIPAERKFGRFVLLKKGKVLAALDRSKDELVLFDTKEWTVLQTMKTGRHPLDLIASADGRQLLVANRGDDSLSVYQVD